MYMVTLHSQCVFTCKHKLTLHSQCVFTCKHKLTLHSQCVFTCKHKLTLRSQCVFTCKHKLAARSRDGYDGKGYRQTFHSQCLCLLTRKYLNLQRVEMDVVVMAQLDASIWGGGGGGGGYMQVFKLAKGRNGCCLSGTFSTAS